MKDVFGQDEKRINHALRVLDYAERIGAAPAEWPITRIRRGCSFG